MRLWRDSIASAGHKQILVHDLGFWVLASIFNPEVAACIYSLLFMIYVALFKKI